MMFYKVLIYTLLCNTLAAVGLPQATLSMHNAVNSFQNAVQQQTFQSVLVAIEERLRNLDNIYSMQLSETIKSKLDQYHRKLESLDIKIIRLESLVMLNLNKISENISTKTYQNDIAVTQTYRKLDNMYDGLSHRISYMDRKSDMAFDKLQNKIETTLLRIEKMEENMMQRNSDTEAELSETLFVLEDLKTSSTSTEQSLLNITNTLHQGIFNAPLMNSINMSLQNLIGDLNQSFIQRLDKVENTSSRSLNVSEESGNFLKSIKLELKEDFNEYANKVADMNVDIWKRNDILDESLKTIETVTNFTRIEVQNGVRTLIVQIGKLSGKGIINNDKISLESLKKSVNLSLEKIITNQELFLESCHRVQMDESQIETEISVMLGKLIDMLEKKMTTVMKDLKSLEKTVKSHDSRTTRNIYQANNNIVSLFEKTTNSSEVAERELQEIKFYINSLFTLVQDVLPKNIGVNQNIEVLLNDLSDNLTNLIKSASVNNDIKWIQLERNLTKYNDRSEKVTDKIKNVYEILNVELNNHKSLSNTVERFLEEIRNQVSDFNKTFSVTSTALTNSNFSNINLISKLNDSYGMKRNICTQDYSDLIDIRADRINCNDDTENAVLHINETKGNEAIGKNITPRPQDDMQLKKAVLDIFGTAPSMINATTEITLKKTKESESKNKNKCIPSWANFIDIRGDTNTSSEECSTSNTSLKKRKSKKRRKSRLNDDDTLEYEDTTENIEGSTEGPLTTENPTESNGFSTEISALENLGEITHT